MTHLKTELSFDREIEEEERITNNVLFCQYHYSSSSRTHTPRDESSSSDFSLEIVTEPLRTLTNFDEANYNHKKEVPQSTCTLDNNRVNHETELTKILSNQGLNSVKTKVSEDKVFQEGSIYGPEPKFPRVLTEHKKSKKIRKLENQAYRADQSIHRTRLELLRDPGAVNIPVYKEPLLERLKRPIGHSHVFRLFWDVFIMIVLCVDLIVLPLQISFLIFQNFMPFEYIIFGAYVLDIIVNFHTTCYFQGIKLKTHKEIAKRYAKSWLAIDMIAAFPYFAIPALRLDEPDDRIILTWGLFRLLRLSKAFKAFRFVHHSQVCRKLRVLFFSTALNIPFKLVKTTIITVVISHWVACIFHWIAFLEIAYGFQNNWLASEELDTADLHYQYLASMVWTLTTLSTVGYGNIAPSSKPEMWFSIFAMIFGVGVFAYMIGNVSAIIQEVTEEETKLKKQVYTIGKFMNQNTVSKAVKKEIQHYLEYLLSEESNRRKDQEEYLDAMPPLLREKVLADVNSRALMNPTLFAKNFGTKFVKELSIHLKEKTLGPEEYIYQEGEEHDRLYVIIRGKIGLYFSKTDQESCVLGNGEVFGETSFFSNKGNLCSSKSLTYSRLLYLEKKDFHDVLRKYPYEKEAFCQIKDKINLYHDYSPLHKGCSACRYPDHYSGACPLLHYIPISTHLNKGRPSKNIQMRQKFERRDRIRFQALKNQSTVVQAAQKIRIDNQMADIMEEEKSVVGDSLDDSYSQKEMHFEKNIQKCLFKLIEEYSHLLGKMTQPQEGRTTDTLRKDQIKAARNKDVIFDKGKIFNRYFNANNLDNVIENINKSKDKKPHLKSCLEDFDDCFIFDIPSEKDGYQKSLPVK